jgi:hypothetical protein
MVAASALIAPVLLSSVIVWVASSVIHMLLPWHKGDYPKVPDEPRFRSAVGPLAIPPGDYLVPRCDSMAEMKSPEFKAKMTEGPVIMMTVMPNGMMGMGRSLSLWFLYLVIVSAFSAWIACDALPQGAPYIAVFRIVAMAAFMGYALALWQQTIWYRRSARVTLMSTIDGLIYALLTAGTFGWLWPR